MNPLAIIGSFALFHFIAKLFSPHTHDSAMSHSFTDDDDLDDLDRYDQAHYKYHDDWDTDNNLIDDLDDDLDDLEI